MSSSLLLLQEKLSAVKRQLASVDDFVSGGEVAKHRETLVLLLRGAARLLAEMNAELLGVGDGDGDVSSPSIVFVRGGGGATTEDVDGDSDDDAIVIEDPLNASSVRGGDDEEEDEDEDEKDDESDEAES